jgi:hypothetical protein
MELYLHSTILQHAVSASRDITEVIFRFLYSLLHYRNKQTLFHEAQHLTNLKITSLRCFLKNQSTQAWNTKLHRKEVVNLLVCVYSGYTYRITTPWVFSVTNITRHGNITVRSSHGTAVSHACCRTVTSDTVRTAFHGCTQTPIHYDHS